MADILRYATGTWSGDLKSGSGTASTKSGALQDVKIGFTARFENGVGTNPEELIAAAHASCFSMALANNLSMQGNVPQDIRTEATLTMQRLEGGWKITKIHLDTEGDVPGIDQAAFAEAAEQTKKTCPISVLLLPGLQEATVSAKLRS